MNRRRTLMLAIAGVIGTLPSLAFAGVLKIGRDRRMSAGAPNIALRPNFQNLKTVGSECQVMSIQHHPDTYSVVTADGRSRDFSETDLRFKIDSSDTGPFAGKPVILSAGSAGDRASVFFASPAEISALIKYQS